MSTEVQLKDEKKVNEKTDELPFEIKGEKDLARLFDEHPKYLEEFNSDPKVFIEKYGNLEKKEQVIEPDNEDFLAPEKSGDNKDEKKPEEKAADSKIEYDFKKVQDQLETAQNEIAELKKTANKDDKKKIEAELKEIDLSNLTDLPDDIDLFSDEGQEKAKKHIQEQTKVIKSLTGFISTYKDKLAEIDGVKKDVGSIKDKAQETEAKERVDNQIDSEFTSIDEMVKTNKDIFGEKVRPVKAIEDDYLESIGLMIKEVADSKAPILDASGNFSKEALTCLELYKGTSEKAKRFQARCKQLNVGLPEDMDVLTKVYEIRGIRNNELSLKDESGKTLKVPDYGRAIENYKGRHIDEIRLRERRESMSSRERAVDNRKRFAPETSPGTAPEEDDISKMSAAEVDRVLKKMPKDRTPLEREHAYNILKFTGASDEEARERSGLDIEEKK